MTLLTSSFRAHENINSTTAAPDNDFDRYSWCAYTALLVWSRTPKLAHDRNGPIETYRIGRRRLAGGTCKVVDRSTTNVFTPSSVTIRGGGNGHGPLATLHSRVALSIRAPLLLSIHTGRSFSLPPPRWFFHSTRLALPYF